MKNSTFVNRVIIGFFILLFMLGMVFINSLFLLFGVLFLSTIAIYEMSLALGKVNLKFSPLGAYIFNFIAVLLSYFYNKNLLLPLLSIYNIILMVYMIFFDKFELRNIVTSIFIAVYISLSYSYIILIGEKTWLFYLFGISSISDTFAYLVGMLIGKNKLYPRLSPNKTVEGAIGGLMGALVFSIIFKLIFKVNVSYFVLGLISIILSAMSMVGDLIASYIKRRAGIKDYGYIFKEHGGVMDRFDSILLISPMVYLFIQYI